jgi:hypothetical protein
MRSDNQRLQSRINGAKSKGPKTPRAKAEPANHNLRLAMLARTVVLTGESRERFCALHRSITDAVLPVDFVECTLVDKMTVIHWKQMRIWALEKAAFQAGNSPEAHAEAARDPARLAPFMRSYDIACDRAFARFLDRLLKLRALRKFLDGAQEVIENKDSALDLGTQDQPEKARE